MSKKILVSAILLLPLFATTALAHGKHKCKQCKGIHDVYSAKDAVLTPTDDLSGQVCFPYKFSSTQDKTQVLGTLRAVTDVDQIQAQPVEPVQMQPVHHVKKTKKKVRVPKENKEMKEKVEIKKDAYQEDVKPMTKSEDSSKESKEGNPISEEKPQDTQPAQPAQVIDRPKSVESDVGVTSTPPATMSKDNSQQPSSPKSEPQPTAVAPQQPSAPQSPVAQPDKVATTPQSQASTSSSSSKPDVSLLEFTPSSKKTTSLEYSASEVEVSSSNMVSLTGVVSELKSSPNLKAKIQSYAYTDSGNMSDARRVSLQRAIRIRKYLIDNDISASRISVNAIEDSTSKQNKVDIQISDTN